MSMEAIQSQTPAAQTDRPEARTRKPERRQVLMHLQSLDDLLTPDHPARVVWAAVQQLDLSRFYEPIKSRQGVAGREPADPAVLISLWLLAGGEGGGRGRRRAGPVGHHPAFRAGGGG